MEKQIECIQWDSKNFEDLFQMLKEHPEIKVVLSFENSKKEGKTSWDKMIGGYLNRLGISPHLKGYHYMKYGITLCMKDPEELESVTKILYPNIAKKYHTTAGKVEHGIRHAITKAWEAKREKEWRLLFGISESVEMEKPTNSQFLATISDYLQLHN